MNHLRVRNGFTLVELLVVLSIMGLLIGMIVAASSVVVKKQKARTTGQVLLKLDQVLEEYLAQRNVVPGFVADQYLDVPDVAPLKTYRTEQYPDRPDASVFLRSVKGVGECDTLVASIPEQFLVTTNGNGDTNFGAMPSVGDSWGEWPEAPQGLVYYVHPDNFLAQALYGRCINKRPYFVSSGPDGRFGHPQELDGIVVPDDETEESMLGGWRADNVYSYEGIDTGFEITSDAKAAAAT